MRVGAPPWSPPTRHRAGAPGQASSEQAGDLLVGADRGVEHMVGRRTVLAHRIDESLQPRQHLHLGVEKASRAVAGEKLLERVGLVGNVLVNGVELPGPGPTSCAKSATAPGL